VSGNKQTEKKKDINMRKKEGERESGRKRNPMR